MPGLKRVVDRLLSLGDYPGEIEPQRSRRRIMVAGALLATLLSIVGIVSDAAGGYPLVAWGGVATLAFTLGVLIVLHLRPRSFPILFHSLFAVVTVAQLVEATLFGGFMESGLVVMFSLIIVTGALLAFGVSAAMWWFASFVGSVIYSLLIPNFVDPVYVVPDPAGDAAFNLIAAGIVVLAVMAYFVRQRDHFQKQSDDLLRNILPDEIADRLKADNSRIADSFEMASVLFVDVVGFTSLSAGMPPVELVRLLDSVFTSFDGLVDGLGLEKIKTIGDEYMVAAGVPRPRSDHAVAIAELALQIRDLVASRDFGGRTLQVRIGVNSGPVVAGIIGRHKFAYDLWGDVVNTASRMQSGGVPGHIQVSASTYELIRGQFVCEPRGPIPVRGKGDMETFILVTRRSGGSAN